MSGWSDGIYDFDNDGWKDLFVARGNVLDDVDKYSARYRYAQPNALFKNLGNGRFAEVSVGAGPGFQLPQPYRGGGLRRSLQRRPYGSRNYRFGSTGSDPS